MTFKQWKDYMLNNWDKNKILIDSIKEIEFKNKKDKNKNDKNK